MELFPIEITTASYHDLLRIPGIGVTSARRIIAARKETQGTFLDFPHLKKMGVVLKRAQYFITCNGKTFLPLKMNQSFILANLLGIKEKLPEPISKTQAYEQLTLFPINIEVEQALSPYINT